MRTEPPTKCFVPLQKLRVRLRSFCCGSLLPVFGVIVSVAFHLMCVHIIFSLVRLLSGDLLGYSCQLG